MSILDARFWGGSRPLRLLTRCVPSNFNFLRQKYGCWGHYHCGGCRGGSNLLLWANADAVRRGGGSPSSRRCGGTTSSAALSSYLYNNNLDGAIPTEIARLTALTGL